MGRELNQLSIFPKNQKRLLSTLLQLMQMVTNPFEVAHSFNKVFCTVAQKKQRIRLYIQILKYQDFLDKSASHKHILFVPYWSKRNWTDIKITQFQQKYSSRKYPYKYIKMFKKELKTLLSNLVNLSFECVTFPEIL